MTAATLPIKKRLLARVTYEFAQRRLDRLNLTVQQVTSRGVFQVRDPIRSKSGEHRAKSDKKQYVHGE